MPIQIEDTLNNTPSRRESYSANEFVSNHTTVPVVLPPLLLVGPYCENDVHWLSTLHAAACILAAADTYFFTCWLLMRHLRHL